MGNSAKGFVLAPKAPSEIYLHFKATYLSRLEAKMAEHGHKIEPRPVMFISTYSTNKDDVEEVGPFDDVKEALTDLQGDDGLPKGTQMYLNGTYMPIKDAVALADDVEVFHFKNEGRDIDTRKYQFLTMEAAQSSKWGMAFEQKPKATATKAKAKKKSKPSWRK